MNLSDSNTAVDEFTRYYAELLDDTYDCVDRIVLNAYFSPGHHGGGFRCWWERLHGTLDNLDDTHLMRCAGRFSRRVHAWGQAKGIPVLHCAAGVRKHEIAEQHLPADPHFTGVFLVLVSKAPAPLWEAKRSANGGLHLQLKKPWPYANHYSFHIVDPEWGHITIKMSGHPPYGAQIILNGHERVEREARQRGQTLVKEGNCFTEVGDAAALAEVADAVHSAEGIGRLTEVCNRWIYSACLCFALTPEEREQSGFRYQYSVYQIEYSRNLRFRDGAILDQLYQGLIDRTRSRLELRSVATLFGYAKRLPRAVRKQSENRPDAEVRVETPSYDLTVFKLHFGAYTLKIYDKGERILRIEVVLHNARALPGRRGVGELPRIVQRLAQMVQRFLNALYCLHRTFLDVGALDNLPQPTPTGAHTLAGVDVNRPRMRVVMQAALALAPHPQGFTVAELAQAIQATGPTWRNYGKRQAAYDLHKLRGKDLVEAAQSNRRYRPTTMGCRIMGGLILLREKVIKPVLAGIAVPEVAPQPDRHGPLDEHYAALRSGILATLATLGIAV